MNYLQPPAPTPTAASVNIMMAVANELTYKVCHLDVAQASTKADLDCVAYTKLSGGCGRLFAKFVRLEKALYGLRQSGLLWNDLLAVHLGTVRDMEQCEADPSVFRLARESEIVLISTIHVNDMEVACPRDELDKRLLMLDDEF